MTRDDFQKAKNIVELGFQNISSWWRSLGFHYLDKMSMNRYGIVQVSLPFILEGKEQEDLLIEEGYDLCGEEDCRCLVDTKNNRNRMLSVIENRFPSAKIISWENKCRPGDNSEDFILKGVIFNVKAFEDLATIDGGETDS